MARCDSPYILRCRSRNLSGRNLAPPEADNSDSLFLVAAFSGGGVRASSLAYGVLHELARQEITWQGRKKRLLDELDVIFALSGGSFPAAYYALYGDRLFQDFEPRFLRKDWESELRGRIPSPRCGISAAHVGYTGKIT